MAGVIPLYDEWSAWAPPRGGKGEGEPHVRRMFDFWYTRTKYRQYRQLNVLPEQATSPRSHDRGGESLRCHRRLSAGRRLHRAGYAVFTMFGNMMLCSNR